MDDYVSLGLQPQVTRPLPRDRVRVANPRTLLDVYVGLADQLYVAGALEDHDE